MISPFKNIYELIKPYICRHKVRYWDMEFVVEDVNSSFYHKFNGMKFSNTFCECSKCGSRWKRDYRPVHVVEFGKFKRSSFIPNETNIIKIKIQSYHGK